MRKGIKEDASKSAVVDEVFANLAEARSSLDYRHTKDAIEVLDGIGNILYHLTENSHMESDEWENLAMGLAGAIDAAVLCARDEMQTLEKGIRRSYEAHDLLNRLRPNRVSIIVGKPIRKRTAAA
jgi:hypothetical protein